MLNDDELTKILDELKELEKEMEKHSGENPILEVKVLWGVLSSGLMIEQCYRLGTIIELLEKLSSNYGHPEERP